jgi:hypothetical protein
VVDKSVLTFTHPYSLNFFQPFYKPFMRPFVKVLAAILAQWLKET